MKRFSLLLYLGLICCWTGSAQQIRFEGTIYDKSTGEPLQGVYVYMNGTSIYTMTDSSGVFTLSLEKHINASLIIRHMAYEQVVIENPYKQMPGKIYLEEARISFEEVRVVVSADKFSRDEKLYAFKRQFLGLSKSGKGCKIENEEDIIISYDREERALKAYSQKPLIIYNNYLGYRVEFSLVNFKVLYGERDSIAEDDFIKFNFSGYSSFEDMMPYDVVMKRRRDEIYEQSSRYFMKQLVNRALEETNFKMFSRYKRVDADDCFVTIGDSSVKSVHLLSEIKNNRYYENISSEVFGSVTLRNRVNESEIIFLTNRFLVDEYGNVDEIDNIIYLGYMNELRFGGMLPLNYEYSK